MDLSLLGLWVEPFFLFSANTSNPEEQEEQAGSRTQEVAHQKQRKQSLEAEYSLW